MDHAALVASRRQFFLHGETRPEAHRRARLLALSEAILRHEEELLEALRADLGKPPVDAWTTEVAPVLAEIRHALRHLSAWMRPRRAKVPPLAWPARAHVVREPYGLALVIGPWNYPFQLLFSPLAAALAAGNAIILKPSEFAPETSRLAARIVDAAFPDGAVTVVEGDHETAAALLRERFDTIFFTGGTAVGRAVMEAAAGHLTPVTLELGGKCPAIVCADACLRSPQRLDAVARRLVWGKFLNAGQTCVAPDHVRVERTAHDALVAAMCRAVAQFRYGPDSGRIVNRRHFQRVLSYLADGAVACGGDHDPARLWIAPTILTGIRPAARVLREEIFGPVLPVVPWDKLDDALADVAALPPPLAVYLFTTDPARRERVVAATRSGGVCVNDTIVHITGHDLPFGGVGESGVGRYHGKSGFDAFTYERVVMRRPLAPDPAFRYPPPRLPLPRLKRILRWLGGA
jgi:aldehyde dehydrogenase (NAD+)